MNINAQEKPDKETKEKSTTIDLIWLIPIATGLIALVFYFGKFHKKLSDSNADWGTFGDYFGGLLNPLIAACTLFVATSVWKLQKRELSATQAALKDQAETARQQRGEQRFFDLFRIYESTLESMNLVEHFDDFRKIPPVLHKGKNAINYFLGCPFGYNNYESLSIWTGKNGNVGFAEMSALKGRFNTDDTKEIFDHYFRVVFRLLQEAEKLLGDDHFRYVKLFRAQLSRGELFLISFNLIASTEGSKMQAMIERYGLLKHLPKSTLRSHLEAEKNPFCFGRKFTAPPSSPDNSNIDQSSGQ